MKQLPISIIIPVYKNYEMFYKYLEINKKYFNGCEVIIMNDYPLENISNSVKKFTQKQKSSIIKKILVLPET